MDLYYAMCERMILASHEYNDWLLDRMVAYNDAVEVMYG